MSVDAAEPPSFIKPPEAITKAAVSQDITLVCEVFGAPDPKITWKRYRQNGDGQTWLEVVPGPPKFRINKQGHLTILVHIAFLVPLNSASLVFCG